jgi:signal transduction histidine kinase
MRTRLTLALLAFFVPLTALLVLSHLQNQDERREQRLESFQTIDETISAVVDGFTRDLETLSLSATVTLGLSGADPASLNTPTATDWLRQIQESSGVLRTIFITDLNGRVTAASNGDPSSVGVDLSSRPYIKALQGGADSVWSGALAGLQTGQTTLVHARTYKTPDGRPLGYFVAALYGSSLSARLPEGLPDDANISLIDDQGQILFTTRERGPNEPSDISESPVFAEVRMGRPVLVKSGETPTDPDKRYGAFVPVKRTGWLVGFTRPASVVDGPVEARFRRDLLITFVLLGAGFVLMVYIGSRLSKPLSTLAEAAGAIAKGERLPLPVTAPDADVLTLERAMAAMSQAVAERENRLREQAHVLETLEAVGDSLASELDFRKAVAAITAAAAELTEAEAAGYFHQAAPEGKPELLSTFGESFPLLGEGPLVANTLAGQLLRESDVYALPGLPLVRPFNGDASRVVRSLLAMPVISRDGVARGGLFLVHSEPRRFTEYHEKLAIGLARRASVVLENARLYSQARESEEQLRQANVAKDEFVGLISHELRTPITTIYGGARLLQTRRSHLADEDVAEMIGSIEEESERLYRLVENLLALARAELSQKTEREPVSVTEITEQVAKQFRGRHPGRPIELNAAEDLPPVIAESTYLYQVLHNLINNADKYSNAGLPIEVDIEQENTEILFHVLDRGPGVAPEELSQIFDSFYRSERTAKQAAGKGLGLTVCKRLIEAMSGRIWASLREGGGLEVCFSLPVAKEEPRNSQRSASGAPATT